MNSQRFNSLSLSGNSPGWRHTVTLQRSATEPPAAERSHRQSEKQKETSLNTAEGFEVEPREEKKRKRKRAVVQKPNSGDNVAATFQLGGRGKSQFVPKRLNLFGVGKSRARRCQTVETKALVRTESRVTLLWPGFRFVCLFIYFLTSRSKARVQASADISSAACAERSGVGNENESLSLPCWKLNHVSQLGTRTLMP